MVERRLLMVTKHVVMFADLETRMNDTLKIMKIEADEVKNSLKRLLQNKAEKIAVLSSKVEVLENAVLKTEGKVKMADANFAKSVKQVEKEFGERIEARDARLLTTKSWRRNFSLFKSKDEVKELDPTKEITVIDDHGNPVTGMPVV